jgi:hypothetical protein
MAVALYDHCLIVPVWVMKPHAVCRGCKGMSRDIAQLREPGNFSDLRTGGEGDHRLGLVIEDGNRDGVRGEHWEIAWGRQTGG